MIIDIKEELREFDKSMAQFASDYENNIEYILRDEMMDQMLAWMQVERKDCYGNIWFEELLDECDYQASNFVNDGGKTRKEIYDDISSIAEYVIKLGDIKDQFEEVRDHGLMSPVKYS